MKLPLKIASRYLFARKLSLVNVISIISVLGVTGMTAALIVILSVFNGFDSLIRSMINQFDPDLKITSSRGKTFELDSLSCARISAVDGVEAMSMCVEETALLQYDGYQYIATIKGVDAGYPRICDIENAVYVGHYQLQDTSGVPFAIVGADVAANLWLHLGGGRPISVYAPLRHDKVASTPDEAFARAFVMPSGVFHIHQDFDSKYVIVSLGFARSLLEYGPRELSALELKLSVSAEGLESVRQQIQQILGGGFVVKDRLQQQDMLYKIMKSEKLSIFVMLTFIIIIASFNIIGALSMLIIDKKHDIQTLSNLGASHDFLRKIFLRTGQLITVTGVAAGLVLGLLICWLQIEFQFIKFPEGQYIIDAYPVELRSWDVVLTVAVVMLIGFVASVFPSRKISAQ